MAKIVKDLNEARNLGFSMNKPQEANPMGQFTELVKEVGKIVEGIRDLRGQAPQQQKNQNEVDGRDFIVTSAEDFSKQAQPFDSKKKEEQQGEQMKNINPKPVALTINQKKIEEQLDLLIQKEIPFPFKNWTIEDIKKNFGMVKGFLIPKLIEGIKYSIEVKEVNTNEN